MDSRSDERSDLNRDDFVIEHSTEGQTLPEMLFLKNARPFYLSRSFGHSAKITSESPLCEPVINTTHKMSKDKRTEIGFSPKCSTASSQKSLEILFVEYTNSTFSSSANKNEVSINEYFVNIELPNEMLADIAETSYCIPIYFSNCYEVSQSIYHLRFSDSNKHIYFEDRSGKWMKHDQDVLMETDLQIQNTKPTNISTSKLKRKSCLSILKTTFLSFVIPRDGAKNSNVYAQNKMREIFYYFLFVLITTIIIIHNGPFHSYHLMKSVKNILVDKSFESQGRTISFESIATVEDVWAFIEGPFLSTISLLGDEKHRKVSDYDKYVLKENRIMGVPRIMQVRMANDSCEILDLFKDVTDYCYWHYDKGYEDKEPFGLGTGNAWTYHSIKELDGYEYTGKITTYGGGGYYLNLTDPKDLHHLKVNNWINRGTRAVFIDFTLYNANLNLFFIAKLIFEKPPSGDIDPSWFPNTTRLTKYVSTADYAVLALEIIFIASIPYFLAKELSEMKKDKAEYFRSMWNYVEILIIIFGVMVLISNLIALIHLGPFLKEALERKGYYLPFTDVSHLSKRNRQISGVMFFLIYIKILRYLNFNKSLNELNATMTRCALDVLNFTVMFVLIFVAFATSGTVLFGSHLLEFNTFGQSMISLFRAILGDFDYLAIESVNGVMGPIFFFSFIFTIFFIMLNMFLAILSDSYGEVKNEKFERKLKVNSFMFGALQKAMDQKWFPKCLIRRRKVVTWDDVFKESGLSADLQTSILLKYQVTAGTPISKCAKQHLTTSLSPIEEQQTDEEDTCQCSKEELTEMKEHLLQMEMSMRRTVAYYDYLVNKTERTLDAWAETARRINICKEVCFPISVKQGNEASVDFALVQLRPKECNCDRKMSKRKIQIKHLSRRNSRSITSTEFIGVDNEQKIRRIKFIEIDKLQSPS